MRIAFNRQPRRSPWGGGAHFATTFADFLVAEGHEVVYRLQPGLDWIVMLDPRHEDGGFDVNEIAYFKAAVDRKAKVLHRVNDTGVTRGGRELDDLIRQANYLVADRTVYISRWVQQHFRKLSCPDGVVITNGCDERFFYPSQAMGLQSPIRLVTHHWSSNSAKGLDLYKRIDDLIDQGMPWQFTYVGRYPAEHVPKHTKVIPPLYGHALGDELRRHDVYVTGARHEACGSHHVEGAACGLPIVYHNEGGGVCEMASRYGVGIDNVNDFEEALNAIVADYRGFCEKALACDLSAATMCRKYLEAMR